MAPDAGDAGDDASVAVTLTASRAGVAAYQAGQRKFVLLFMFLWFVFYAFRI